MSKFILGVLQFFSLGTLSGKAWNVLNWMKLGGIITFEMVLSTVVLVVACLCLRQVENIWRKRFILVFVVLWVSTNIWVLLIGLSGLIVILYADSLLEDEKKWPFLSKTLKIIEISLPQRRRIISDVKDKYYSIGDTHGKAHINDLFEKEDTTEGHILRLALVLDLLQEDLDMTDTTAKLDEMRTNLEGKSETEKEDALFLLERRFKREIAK